MIINKEFYFIRHGQTDYNAENRRMGQLDIPLNSIGKQQAYEKQELCSTLPIATICHSPLSRAAETMEICMC